jgi:uncharacterized membrane protein
LTATRVAKDVGLLIALVFAVLGFVYPTLVMLPLIAVAVFYGAITEERMVQSRKVIAPDVPAGRETDCSARRTSRARDGL